MNEVESVPKVSCELFSGQPGVRFGMSTRIGGTSPEPLGMNLSFHVGDMHANVVKNRSLFFGSLGIPPDQIAVPRQCHSANVQEVSAPGIYESCDALVTHAKNVFLAISVADCVPIFLLDPSKRCVAAVHAGWRGTQKRILEGAIQAMRARFGTKPADILAFIGPSARVCCYEIGNDVAAMFDNPFVADNNGRLFLDLVKANMNQLQGFGVSEQNIEVNRSCTIGEPEMFHSFRREKERSGRMMGVIGLV